jgi:hypothetical protein
MADVGAGISATSAIFTIVNAALFRPLPYPNPEELVVLTTPSPREACIAGEPEVQACQRRPDAVDASRKRTKPGSVGRIQRRSCGYAP